MFLLPTHSDEEPYFISDSLTFGGRYILVSCNSPFYGMNMYCISIMYTAVPAPMDRSIWRNFR